MNVYLIGMMGSGKTAVGEALAVLTGLDFVDLDSRIEKRENRSISEIFASSGEAFFAGWRRRPSGMRRAVIIKLFPQAGAC